MKKLTLDETWKNCLRMCKWIKNEQEKDNKECVGVLKRDWFEKFGFADEAILYNCFFCDYSYRHGEKKTGLAINNKCNCPAMKIDPSFRCNNVKYDYENNPGAFYAKLVSLNKIRLARRKKSRQK